MHKIDKSALKNSSASLIFVSKFLIIFSMTILNSCSSTTEDGEVGAGRNQMMLVSSEEITAMAAKSYEETKAEAKSKNALNKNPEQYKRVLEISKRLTPYTSVFRKDAPAWKWEVHVISSDEINAYCMPGGKIMFYSGIIDKLKLTDGEIAAIMGHEIAHALREHGRERMSQEIIKQVGISALVMSGAVNEKYAGVAAVGSAIFISLPHGRGQESEADDIGLELMARAGYDPREAVTLWKKMGAASGGKTPEFLSTHPSDKTRISRIESLLPKVMPLYQQKTGS